MREALDAIGYRGEAQPHKLAAYFEAHIEQGAVLEDTQTTIGVVLGALRQRWLRRVDFGGCGPPQPEETRG